MPKNGYVKLSNGFWRNTKIRKLRTVYPSGVSAYVMMLSYAGDQLTDGYVDNDTTAYVLGITTDETDALQECGLIEPAENGWYIHDFLDYNREREKVMQRRDYMRDYMRDRREQESCKQLTDACKQFTNDSKHDVSTPLGDKHQNTRTPEHQEKEEELHSSSKESENLTADDWAHTGSGAEAISLMRGQYAKLDMRDTLQAFTAHHGQAMKPPGMWARLFQGWCDRRATIAQVPEQHRHTHTWACEHTLAVLGLTDRTQVDDETMGEACRIANQLNERENES